MPKIQNRSQRQKVMPIPVQLLSDKQSMPPTVPEPQVVSLSEIMEEQAKEKTEFDKKVWQNISSFKLNTW